jgi:hypothetical protein
MDDFQGIFRDLVNASSEDDGISCIVKTEENDCLVRSGFATKVKGSNSNSNNHAVINRGFYKAAIIITMHVHNNYYHILSKLALNYITIAINNAEVFRAYVRTVVATCATWDDFD